MLRVALGAMALMTIHVPAAFSADESSPAGGDVMRSGHAVYEQYCASCHGAKGEGAQNWQKRDEHGELPAPPHNAEGHTWRHSDTMLYEMINKGLRDPFNKTQRLTMPAFEHVLSPDQIRAVIAYLKSLWTPEQRGFQEEENRGQLLQRNKP